MNNIFRLEVATAGNHGLSEAAEIMVDAVASFLDKSAALERVTFVLFGDEAYNTFRKKISGLQK